MVKYVPILKWKAGEKDSIRHLSQKNLNDIFPIIELVDSINENNLLKEIYDTGLKSALIDNSYSEEETFKFYDNLINSKSDLNLIPVFYIDDLYNEQFILNHYNEISIRLEIPQPINSNINYQDLFKKILKKSDTKIDLILDLIFIEDVQAATLKSIALNQTLLQLENYYQYINKIIISSTSFPKDLSNLGAGEEKKYPRYELSVFNKIHDIPQCNNLKDKLIYSDYGVNKFTDTEVDFSKFQYGILPKVKYSTEDFYYVQKGKKDRIKNTYTISTFDMCDKIINSDFFYGKDFSYGDNEIYKKATEKKGPGGNKDWVTISTIHHIAAILKQLSN